MKRRVGEYELLQFLGKGGMAEVYSARRADSVEDSKLVAIKLLLEDLGEQAAERGRFVHEARLTMPLQHSNIVQTLEVGEADGRAYMVMEHVSGPSLDYVMQKMAAADMLMPVDVAVYIVDQVARALAFIADGFKNDEKMGTVHRDISPHNILVSDAGDVKLADFGLARLIWDDSTGRTVIPPGKRGYMPREQYERFSRAPTVDLYALGAVLHELLTGEKFRSGDRDAQLAPLMAMTIPPMTRADVPSEIDDIRLALLASDPFARIQSAQGLRDRLKRWPGYRNADDELARLVWTLLGLRGARASTADTVPPPKSTLTPSASRRASTPSHTPTPHGEETDPGRAEEPQAALVPMSSDWRGKAAIAVGGGVVGALVVVGAFTFAGSDPPAPRVAAAIEPETPAPSPPAPAPEPAPEPEPPPAPVEEPPAPEPPPAMMAPDPEPRSVEMPKPRAQPKPRASPKPKPKPEPRAPARVRVRFRLEGPRLRYVLIDGRKQLILEPIAEAMLTVGRHRLRWKAREDDAWQDGGTVTLEAGAEYTVKMLEAGIRLERS